MNIDFHYGIVYVMARLGGLPAAEAQTVAHACQYVDDATTHGVLHFVGGESFERFATAHKMFDYENAFNERNRLVWAPFHFLPAGVGDTLEDRAICRPDSEIAREVVRRAIRHKGADNDLHRLGITLHTYVDTWAHQGFSGVESDYNKVSHLETEDCTPTEWLERLEQATQHLIGEIESAVLTRALPLGHGAALHYPDQPWANWTYTNGKGIPVKRENLPDFVSAANMACRAVQAFCAGKEDFDGQPGLTEAQKSALQHLFETNQSTNEKERLHVIHGWIEAGEIPGLKERLPTYTGKGIGSWKYLATGSDAQRGDGVPTTWSIEFEQSDYRKFHDAVKEHRFLVVQELLPANKLRLA